MAQADLTRKGNRTAHLAAGMFVAAGWVMGRPDWTFVNSLGLMVLIVGFFVLDAALKLTTAGAKTGPTGEGVAS